METAPSAVRPSARSGAVDLLKTIAIFSVIVIHTAPGGYTAPLGSFDWCSAVFWGSLTRAAVPLFLMCSGALLLDPGRPLTLKKLWFKNILRVVVAMLVWAMVYKVFWLWTSPAGLTPAALLHAVKEVLLFRQEFHFYYLHIILLVYAFLPVTRVFVARAERRELLYFLVLWCGLGLCYPIARHFWPLKLLSGTPVQWMINQAYAAIGYGVLGFFLRREGLRRARPWALLFLAGFAGVFGVTVWRSLANNGTYTLFFEAMSPCVAMMAAGLFGAVCARVRPGAAVSRWVTHVSKASFCIYLVHVLFLQLLRRWGLDVSILPPLASIPLVTVAVYLCCEGVYLVLSRIPVVRDYLV